MTNLRVYVDACRLWNGAIGVGIVCPQCPSINAGEPAPRNLGSDVNIGELYAIIRAMEKASAYNISHLTIVSDSTAAVSTAQSSYGWSPHYMQLWDKFQNAKSQLGCPIAFELVHGGDYHHNTADELARKGAENW